jgi:YggT family protein
MNALAGYTLFLAEVRRALLYIGVFVALVCAIDWAVRTRRINPFSRIARFFRGSIDPFLAPVERVIVRAGGVPSSAAWWALVAYIVIGILLISVLQFVGQLVFQIIAMTMAPLSEDVPVIAHWAFSILRLALLVRVLSSWLPVSPYSRWIRWSYVLTNWMIVPLQRFMPRVGPFDITPLVVWVLLDLAEKVLLS